MVTKNIVHIVHENTSTIDTLLPLLLGLKQSGNNYNITILYLKINKKQITRDDTFINRFCKKENIIQKDLKDFINPFFLIILKPFLVFSNVSYYDYISKSEFNSYNILYIIKHFLYLYPSFRRKINDLVIKYFLNGKSIMQVLSPDLIFWDHREKIKYVHKDDLYEYFKLKKIPVILLPHSPHDITDKSEFVRFGNCNNPFPEFCRYWIAFPPSKAWTLFPNRKEDFIYFGYPAFDDNWITYCSKLVHIDYSKNSQTNIVVPLRMFTGEGITNDTNEKFMYTYADTKLFINKINNIISKKFNNYKIIFKPHPKTNKFWVKKIINQLGIENCEISFDLFFGLLPSANLVITSFSTTIIMMIFYKKPTFIIDSDTQSFVQKWQPLNEIYSKLNIVNLEELEENIDFFQSRENLYEYPPEFRNYWKHNSVDIGVKNIERFLNY